MRSHRPLHSSRCVTQVVAALLIFKTFRDILEQLAEVQVTLLLTFCVKCTWSSILPPMSCTLTHRYVPAEKEGRRRGGEGGQFFLYKVN